MIQTHNESHERAHIVYKLQKLERLSLRESSLTVLETISITTSYTKAMEVMLEHPSYFVVPHAIVQQKRPLSTSRVTLSGI